MYQKNIFHCTFVAANILSESHKFFPLTNNEFKGIE